MPAPSKARRLFALGLVLALLLALLATGFLAYRAANPTDDPYSLSGGGKPLPDEKERQRAMTVAEQFALRVDAVDTGDLPGYIKSVSELLTAKFKAKFESGIDETLGAPTDAPSGDGEKATGKVYSTGVLTMDADSATVLVAHDQDFVVNGRDVGQGFRWVVQLRKVGGTWLVDDSTDIDGNG